MKSPPALAIAAACCVALACDGRSPRDGGAGRLTVERTGHGGKRLVDAATRGSYCASESTLVIITVGGRWMAGIAARGVWPPGAERSFTIRPTVEGPGTAAASLRPIGDGVGAALVAVSGVLRLEPRPRATGHLEVTAAEGEGQGAPVRLIGDFRDVEISADCGPLVGARGG